MERPELDERLDRLAARADGLPMAGLGKLARVQAALVMLAALERICANQDEDPGPALETALAAAVGTIEGALAVAPELDLARFEDGVAGTGVEHTIELFQQAWTSYSDETYDHSVTLVRKRLANSGFDEAFFAGKTCFDGGCGTGRLSLAMAQLGAKQVVAADLGQESLDYFRTVVARHGTSNIEIVEQDVTDLSPWRDGGFDFVASNGVLHHTEHPDRGIREHFRITRPGGIFWVYLYGADGLYWHVYDKLRPLVAAVPPAEIRGALHALGVREGLIYTFLDNFLAPRVYYALDDVLDLLGGDGAFAWKHAKGMSEIDDTQILLSKKFGSQIYGPQGEVRIAVTKAA